MSSCPGTICAAQRYRLHATYVSKKKTTKTVDRIIKSGCSIEVSLESSSPADVQSNAMVPTAQHFGVPQLQVDYVKTLLLEESDQCRLIRIDHNKIRVNAE